MQAAASHPLVLEPMDLKNDDSVFSNSSFGKAFSSGDLNVSPIKNIPGTSISIPLYFVGDEAFLLKPQKCSEYN